MTILCYRDLEGKTIKAIREFTDFLIISFTDDTAVEVNGGSFFNAEGQVIQKDILCEGCGTEISGNSGRLCRSCDHEQEAEHAAEGRSQEGGGG